MDPVRAEYEAPKSPYPPVAVFSIFSSDPTKLHPDKEKNVIARRRFAGAKRLEGA